MNFFESLKINNIKIKNKIGAAFTHSESGFGSSDTLDAILKTMMYFQMIIPSYGSKNLSESNCSITPKGLESHFIKEMSDSEKEQCYNFGKKIGNFIHMLHKKIGKKTKVIVEKREGSDEDEVKVFPDDYDAPEEPMREKKEVGIDIKEKDEIKDVKKRSWPMLQRPKKRARQLLKEEKAI